MILRVALLSGAATLALGAAPPSVFITAPVLPPVITVQPQPLPDKPTSPPGFAPAPLPNREAAGPVVRATKDASVTPGFFTRRDQYRGEGLSAINSAQTEQDRRAQPGGGINLSMPLQ